MAAERKPGTPPGPVADDIGMNEDDERAAKKKLAETGEPQRDRLGNDDGAS